MTTQPATPIRSTIDLVADLIDLQDQAAHIDQHIKAIRAKLADQIGVGNTFEGNGIRVSVREPSRRLNVVRAWALLTPEQQTLAVSPDAAKIKAQIAPALLDSCYDAGAGAPIVTVR